MDNSLIHRCHEGSGKDDVDAHGEDTELFHLQDHKCEGSNILQTWKSGHVSTIINTKLGRPPKSKNFICI